MSNHEPERTCVVCRKKSSKDNFIKIVRNKSGDVAVEKDKKLDGRGAYVCKDEKCLAILKKSRALNRSFKAAIPENFYEGIVNNDGIE
jgi:predicted RNA-binding protein YlxR (DUF448 family)